MASAKYSEHRQGVQPRPDDEFLKIVYLKTSGSILGVHIFGKDASEMINHGAAFVNRGQTIWDVIHSIPPAVTYDEVSSRRAPGVLRAWPGPPASAREVLLTAGLPPSLPESIRVGRARPRPPRGVSRARRGSRVQLRDAGARRRTRAARVRSVSSSVVTPSRRSSSVRRRLCAPPWRGGGILSIRGPEVSVGRLGRYWVQSPSRVRGRW